MHLFELRKSQNVGIQMKQPSHDPDQYQRGTTGATDRELVKQSRSLIKQIQQALHETILERHERKAAEAQQKEQEQTK